MNIQSLTARIAELQGEVNTITEAFNIKKAEVASLEEQWNAYRTKAQQRVTHLEGCIAEATRIKGELEAIAPPPSPPEEPPIP